MNPARSRSRVVLPQPEGPASVTNSPGSMVRSMWSRAGTAAPPTSKWWRTPSKAMARPWLTARPSRRDRRRRARRTALRADGVDLALLEEELRGGAQVAGELAAEVVGGRPAPRPQEPETGELGLRGLRVDAERDRDRVGGRRRVVLDQADGVVLDLRPHREEVLVVGCPGAVDGADVEGRAPRLGGVGAGEQSGAAVVEQLGLHRVPHPGGVDLVALPGGRHLLRGRG